MIACSAAFLWHCLCSCVIAFSVACSAAALSLVISIFSLRKADALACRRRPYRVECTGSLLTSEVKRHRARLVLGWGTAWEDLRVLSALKILDFMPKSCNFEVFDDDARRFYGGSVQVAADVQRQNAQTSSRVECDSTVALHCQAKVYKAHCKHPFARKVSRRYC